MNQLNDRAIGSNIDRLRLAMLSIMSEMRSTKVHRWEDNLIEKVYGVSMTLKSRVSALENEIDQYLYQVNSARPPKSRSSHPNSYRQRQQFHGKRGSLNDALKRLKKQIRALKAEIDSFGGEMSGKVNQKTEAIILDRADPIDLSETYPEQVIDGFNTALVMVIALIKWIKMKRK
ncbi:MAG: hypothetical protein AAFV80_24410 [Bacteroidota bacterium]